MTTLVIAKKMYESDCKFILMYFLDIEFPVSARVNALTRDAKKTYRSGYVIRGICFNYIERRRRCCLFYVERDLMILF